LNIGPNGTIDPKQRTIKEIYYTTISNKQQYYQKEELSFI
jgi:hypothetical protein